ncbi:hypothetical protein EDD85DRAFT_793522 [Armillaria nabsnona]|nr:hypothetical protein EDD85DRAFT_793522 [Armillaria nabsnona]
MTTTMLPPLMAMTTPAHALLLPRKQTQSPPQPTHYLPHRHRRQSLPYTTSIAHGDIVYVVRFDISSHFRMEGGMERRTNYCNDHDEHDEHDDDDGQGWADLSPNCAEEGAGMAEGAGDFEEEGGKMVGTPTVNDGDDVKALHAIKEGLEGTTNAL